MNPNQPKNPQRQNQNPLNPNKDKQQQGGRDNQRQVPNKNPDDRR